MNDHLNASHLTATALDGVAHLTHLGVIQVEGEDAAKFLHGQLTQDFSLLGLNQARLAAFCSAKGRMQASFIGFKRPDGKVVLVCHRDILAPTLKRLSMFVLRAKALLSDATEVFSLYGLAGSATKNIAADAGLMWTKGDFDDQSVVTLYPADGINRQLVLQSAGSPLPSGQAMTLDDWLWSEVRSGVATLSASVVEAFVPQMLNYESVGGVNFKKGCYPGQEVVARSQFRGTLKRRSFLFHSPSLLAAGDEVFSKADSSQPAGTVVQVAAVPVVAQEPQYSRGFDALISVQLSALELGPLFSPGSTQELVQLPLPYPLLEDV
jgi:folate-binding protein YgfZ